MKVYIVMGVSGVGKSTIGKSLSEELQIPFYDADDFHPEGNILKMKSRQALNDKDRQVWLQILSEEIKSWNKGEGAILACSALRESYRKQLQVIPEKELHWIFLYSDYETILDRIEDRKGHFFKSDLLKSQYEILEYPEYGIRVNVNTSKTNIIKKIMKALSGIPQPKIGILGLGVMGKSLALNLASNEIQVAVFNREVEGEEEDIAKNFAVGHKEKHEFLWFNDLEGFVESLEPPRVILIMIKAGKAVDAVIENLLPFLDKNDLIIDGGNSHYKDTARRTEFLIKKEILYMGLGISGGEQGALHGPSLMPGGAVEAYKLAGTLLEKIAAKDKNDLPCCAYIGPEGAGHFVKMVHNGIEYGEMQLIAEIYYFIRFYTNSKPESIALLFEEWNKEMNSYLLGISVDILRKKEDNGFLLDKILDAAQQKGTGGWSTEAALELDVSLDTITAAVQARHISAQKELRTMGAKLYNFKKGKGQQNLQEFSEELFKAYKAGSIINHAIGFDLLTTASKNYNWDLNLSEIARIWTAGCIIKSGFMEEISVYFKEIPEQHILFHPKIVSQISAFRASMTTITCKALKHQFAMPVLSAATNYLFSLTTLNSAANLIQAQRDYFGAHTFERTDKPRGEFFHSEWKEQRE